jgi:tetratricopeptide (TPR) repeat protein
MGGVYRVRNVKTGQQFAVKCVAPNLIRDETRRFAFFKRLQLWRALPKHRHTVQCWFWRDFGDSVGLFMDLVEAPSLQRCIDSGRLTKLDDILDVAIQTAWGLHAAHLWGIVHGDVKPGNFLVAPRRTVLATDFGLAQARAQAGETAEGHLAAIGHDRLLSSGGLTAPFCSPEQWGGAAPDLASDVWSWGLTVLALFKGGVDWDCGIQANEVLEGFLRAGSASSDLPSMPGAVARILRRCFRAAPAERWDTLLEPAELLRETYREHAGYLLARGFPGFPRPATKAEPGIALNMQEGAVRSDPRPWLEAALRSAGRDPDEAKQRVLRRVGSDLSEPAVGIAAYEEASGIYQELIAQGSGHLLSEYAGLCCSHGSFLATMSKNEEALALYAKAVAIYKQLVAAGQEELEPNLALAYEYKAIALRAAGNMTEAVASYDGAVLLREKLVDAGAANAETDLARSLLRKGNALFELGNAREALACYDRCIVIWESLVKAGRADLEQDLAGACIYKGYVLSESGNPDVALACYDRGITLYERLVKAGHIALRPHLASAYEYKASLAARLDATDTALENYDNCIKIREHLIDAGSVSLWPDLAQVYERKGHVLYSVGDKHGALGSYDRCIAIREDLVAKGRKDLRGDLARSQLCRAEVVLNMDVSQREDVLRDARCAMQTLRAEAIRTGRQDLRKVIEWGEGAFENRT